MDFLWLCEENFKWMTTSAAGYAAIYSWSLKMWRRVTTSSVGTLERTSRRRNQKCSMKEGKMAAEHNRQGEQIVYITSKHAKWPIAGDVRVFATKHLASKDCDDRTRTYTEFIVQEAITCPHCGAEKRGES